MRIDDGERKFPIDPKNPLVVTKMDGICTIYQKAYTLSSKDVAEEFIMDTLNWEPEWTLIGAWVGEWKTDVFSLNVDEIRDRVIEYGRMRWKTFNY